MKRFAVMSILLFALAVPHVHGADDHADLPSGATMIPRGSAPVPGILEHDLDRDWFRFLAAPSLVYTIQVSNVTLWDNGCTVRAFADGETLIGSNSAFTAGSTRIIWTNSGGERLYFVGISPLFDFTTGTYTVAVSTNDADADGDGMADAWEQAMFGTLTNQALDDPDLDGLTTIQEYRSGTHPGLAVSGLRVTNILLSAGGAQVGWPAVAYGSYRVDSTTNPAGTLSWQACTSVISGGSPGPMVVVDGVTSNLSRHYRVVYE